MNPFTSNEFNKLNWKAIGENDLNCIIEGMKILGTEPINYPLTDGIIIYLKDKDGAINALDISISEYETKIELQIADKTNMMQEA